MDGFQPRPFGTPKIFAVFCERSQAQSLKSFSQTSFEHHFFCGRQLDSAIRSDELTEKAELGIGHLENCADMFIWIHRLVPFREVESNVWGKAETGDFRHYYSISSILPSDCLSSSNLILLEMA
jgi:hypothetical protein